MAAAVWLHKKHLPEGTRTTASSEAGVQHEVASTTISPSPQP